MVRLLSSPHPPPWGAELDLKSNQYETLRMPTVVVLVARGRHTHSELASQGAPLVSQSASEGHTEASFLQPGMY